MSAYDVQQAAKSVADAKRVYNGGAAALAAAEQAYRNLGLDPNEVSASSAILITDYNGKAIANFSFLDSLNPAFSGGDVVGIITGTAIALTVPAATVVTALIASFGSTGATVKVGATPQVSGTTANNFTSPVVYTVTAQDGSTQTYTVTVTVSP